MPALSIRLPCMLHARPASAVVLLASMYESQVQIRRGAASASAKNALELLSLGVPAGELVVLEAEGSDASEALEALRQLVESSFREDTLPEPAVSAAGGLALGTAVVLADPEPNGEIASDAEALAAERGSSGALDRDRLLAAFAKAARDVASLADSLPAREAALFAPELDVLSGLQELALARLEAGAQPAVAVTDAAALGATDLVRDARDRVLDALAGRSFLRRLHSALALARRGAGRSEPKDASSDAMAREPIVLVSESPLTPTLVAILPDEVVGIVASGERPPEGPTGHAAILARGRGLPVVYVPERVTRSIRSGQRLLLDAASAPARLWIAPSDALVAEAASRQTALSAAANDGVPTIDHLGIHLRVNVGSLREPIPRGVDGVGLLRTELLFAGRRAAPTEAEQLATLLAIARSAAPGPLVVRLFDGGGDKPIPWLGTGPLRGVELLLRNPDVLAAQLRAIARARVEADVRALVPLVRSEHDMAAVRAVAPPDLPLGAMIETNAGVLAAEAIAAVSESLSIGTNDLAADALGIARSQAVLSLDRRLLRLVSQTIDAGHTRKRPVTICGEIAGTERGAVVLVGLGADALSVSPARVRPVSLALSAISREECRAAAQSALAADSTGEPPSL